MKPRETSTDGSTGALTTSPDPTASTLSQELHEPAEPSERAAPNGPDPAAWRVVAHYRAGSLAPDWRKQLALRLGAAPRRLGTWAELVLHGARQCLDAAGGATLPPDALLRVVSLRGPQAAIITSTRQFEAGALLPFGFLQTQPSQMLAGLSQYLDWQGDACFVLQRDAAAMWRLAHAECGPAGLLIGWVDEGGAGEGVGDGEGDGPGDLAAPEAMSSAWWRVVPLRP